MDSISFTIIPTFDSDIHPNNLPQFNWIDLGGGMHTCRVAGKEMLIIPDESDNSFRLTYLDQTHKHPFKTPEEAKQSAPQFAITVLSEMIEVISEFQSSSRKPASTTENERSANNRSLPSVVKNPALQDSQLAAELPSHCADGKSYSISYIQKTLGTGYSRSQGILDLALSKGYVVRDIDKEWLFCLP